MRCLHEDFVEGATFHIYNHAIDDYDLFYDDEDYDYFLSIFEENLKKVPASIYAYCLMPNHYHFLIRQDSEMQVYRLFNYAFVKYAKYFNEKYNRRGPIFRSPLQHKAIDNDIYLFQLSKYIHLNPVRKELVENPEEWSYSNYDIWVNGKKSNSSQHKIIEELNVNPQKYKEYIKSISNYLSLKELKELTS